jgi:hypothetical protein
MFLRKKGVTDFMHNYGEQSMDKVETYVHETTFFIHISIWELASRIPTSRFRFLSAHFCKQMIYARRGPLQEISESIR